MPAPTSWSLPNGDLVEVTPVMGGFTAQLQDSSGAAEGALFSAIQPQMGLYTFQSVTELATGGYAIDYIYGGALLPGFYIDSATFSADGQLLGQSRVSNESGAFPMTYGQIYALPDGGFVEAWADGAPYSVNGANEVMIREFNANGQPTETAQSLGVLASGQIGVQVASDGAYTVSWQSPMGAQQQTFDQPQSPPTSNDATGVSGDAPATDATFVAQTPVTLTASAGWTSAVVLANHALAIVGVQDDGYGSHIGAEQTYSASGSETSSATMMGYAGAGQTLTPQITSLGQGGLYEVSYAGSSNYEVYDSADQMVFAHNAYTNPNAQLTALTGGGYVVTDFPDQAMALYNSQGQNEGWYNLSSSAPTSIVARADGGFDFVYADHIVGYDAQGQQDMNSAYGVSTSNFASAAVATSGNNGVLDAWLSPDDGQNGLATSIRVQWLAPGAIENRAVEIGQDLDPWHTTFQLQAHADGSAAILWSQGGGIFGAEYSGGAVGSVFAAVAGDLSTTDAIQLAGDKVGLAYIQGGDLWAEIFDPSTGSVQRADLGASNGDLANVHALATASGGIAVSWHEGSGVVGAVLGASGQASAASALPGDFLGVDAAGHAVTLHDVGGTPVMQTYALNDGLFWAA